MGVPLLELLARRGQPHHQQGDVGGGERINRIEQAESWHARLPAIEPVGGAQGIIEAAPPVLAQRAGGPGKAQQIVERGDLLRQAAIGNDGAVAQSGFVVGHGGFLQKGMKPARIAAVHGAGIFLVFFVFWGGAVGRDVPALSVSPRP